jgi:hypothetical protein
MSQLFISANKSLDDPVEPLKAANTFETNSIYKFILEQVNAHLREYGVMPGAIVIGPDIHLQLLDRETSYITECSWETQGSKRPHLSRVVVVLSMRIKGFLLVPGLTDDDRVTDDLRRHVRNYY